MVQEYVTGGELFERLITKGAYSESDARLLFRRLLQAVMYFHDRNIVHRDLKPENILIVSTDDDTYGPVCAVLMHFDSSSACADY